MLIQGLGRSIQADREREIEERMRVRGLLQDAAEAPRATVPQTSIAARSAASAGARSTRASGAAIPTPGRTR